MNIRILSSYYMFCVGSRSSGSLLLSVQARLHETNLVGGVSSWVKNEIQRITISTIVIPEEQVCFGFFSRYFSTVSLIRIISEHRIIDERDKWY